MARPGGESSGLFYPSPDLVVDYLAHWLTPAPGAGVIRLLDPCAGMGAAAAQLAAALGAETYGIELNAERGAACAATLTHTLIGSCFEMQVATSSFSLMLLNPPYTATGDADRRLEQAFLAATTRALAPDGVLLFLIMQRWLGASARYLAAHYAQLQVYRFPDPEFAQWRQIVVVGTRKPRAARDEAAAAWLTGLVTADLPPLPPAPPAGLAPYRVPRLPQGSIRFCSAQPTAEQLLADLTASGGAWGKPLLRSQLWPAPTATRAVQPLMPLRTGHLAMLLAAGLLDNLVLAAGDERLLLKGRVVKEFVEVEVDDDKGEVREIERIHTELTTLDLTSGRLTQITTGAGDPGASRPTLADFMTRYREPLAALVRAAYPPRYSAAQRPLYAATLATLKRAPRGAQADVIRATALSLLQQGHAALIGEMGTGKTLMAIAAAAILAREQGSRRPFRVVVVCPPTLVSKWQREVFNTLPDADALIAETMGVVAHALRYAAAPLQFLIVSRERAKLGAARRAAVWRRLAPRAGRERVPCCPQCGAGVPLSREGVPLTDEEIVRGRARCAACRTPLWQAQAAPLPPARQGRFRWGDGPRVPVAGRTGEGPRRFPLADYLRRRARGRLDLAVIDEAHEAKARESAQGMAAAAIAGTARRVLTLTGTLMGGKASSLFYLLHRFSPPLRAEFGYREVTRWIDRYGVWERISKLEEEPAAYGAHTRRKLLVKAPQERPGVAPSIVRHVLSQTAFVRLAEVEPHLPPYREAVHRHQLAAEQAAAYAELETALLAQVRQALAAGSKRLLGVYLQSLLTYPDACVRGETVYDPATGAVLARAPALPAEQIYPKERALIDRALRERGQGRRMLVYCTHTGTRDITARLARLLGEAGLRVAVLTQGSAEPRGREAWLAARVRSGVDVVLTNPRLVSLGLDLLAFPTISWAEIDYSLYTLRQASRRSWRLGQARDVEIHFDVYDGTLQARALALVARKLQAALQVEGESTEVGLVGAEVAEQDLVTELARSLSQAAGDEQSLEALFAAVQAVEASQREVLVSDAVGESAGGAPDLPDLPALPAAPVNAGGEAMTEPAGNLWLPVPAPRRAPRLLVPVRSDVAQLSLFPLAGAVPAPDPADELHGAPATVRQLTLW